ncbi:MAG: hypothetical protein ACI8PQ_001110 [Planctomycetota bacterium]|jgi:hypothetical protein
MGQPQGFLSRLLGRTPAVVPGGPGAIPVVLFTKRVCPLCDEIKGEFERVRTTLPWTLEVVEIDGNPALEEAHGRSVPVVSILGRPAFKGRMTAAEFVNKLARRAGEMQ